MGSGGTTALVPPGKFFCAQYAILYRISGVACARNETWGNGQIHLTTRQKLAMPGIRYEDIDNVNAALEPFLREIEI
ncbi:hypothetical protein MJM28_29940, partial [Salmonella enterica subsp. enterica serovar Montevideo]|nr:hypothetical protein [Salmonella enterica subsp. enterica serovar Montevideo]